MSWNHGGHLTPRYRWLKIFLIAFGVAIAAIFLIVHIANSGDPRSEENRNGVINFLAGVLPLMLWLGIAGVILAIIRFAVRLLRAVEDPKPYAQAVSTQPGFPVVMTTSTDDLPAGGPGQYRIEGVHKETKMDTSRYFQANSAANAKVKAELEGIVVTSIKKVPL
ncbi:MAG TPA: hypothetical protein VGG44_11015 [Tepidisphaeraceae bacterium]